MKHRLKIDRPYLKLLTSLRPTDGEYIGYGWREVRRQFLKREIALRFDASDWRQHGGALPRRLAASFDQTFWSLFEPERPALDRLFRDAGVTCRTVGPSLCSRRRSFRMVANAPGYPRPEQTLHLVVGPAVSSAEVAS
jgi:hypothetical protein